MYRQIVTPQNTQLLLQIPAEFVGKQVEVIAFEVNEEISIVQNSNKEKRFKELTEKLENYRVNMSNFKFDRNEANDYD